MVAIAFENTHDICGVVGAAGELYEFFIYARLGVFAELVAADAAFADNLDVGLNGVYWLGSHWGLPPLLVSLEKSRAGLAPIQSF